MVAPGWKTDLRMVAYTRVLCVRACACASLIDRIDSLLCVCGDMLTVQEKVLFRHAGGGMGFLLGGACHRRDIELRAALGAAEKLGSN